MFGFMGSMFLSIFQGFDSSVEMSMFWWVMMKVVLIMLGGMLVVVALLLGVSWKSRWFVMVDHLFCLYGKLYPSSGELLLGFRHLGFRHYVVVLSLSVFFLNLSGLVPGAIGWTSQAVFPLVSAVTSWGAIMIQGLWNDWEHVLAGLVPEGTPNSLVFLVVCSEVVSVFARPITLSVRLFANMVAGHLILYLVSILVVWMSFGWGVLWVSLSLLFFMLLLGVILFEVGVGFLQSYIYGMLVGMYAQE